MPPTAPTPKPTHTPGPWTTHAAGIYSAAGMVADCFHHLDTPRCAAADFDAADANARLIAAAPEMLEALVKEERFLCAFCEHVPGDHLWMVNNRIIELRAAIAKATGGEG